MAFLGPLEWARVRFLRPDIRAALTAIMADFETATGEHTSVADQGGVRTHEQQTAIRADSLAQDFRAAPPGQSPHEYGAAFDLHIVGHTTGDAAKDKASPLYEKLAQIGEAHGLRAGQHFKTGKPDPYHFEAKESLNTMREKWATLSKERLRRGGIVALVLAVVVVAILSLLSRRKSRV